MRRRSMSHARGAIVEHQECQRIAGEISAWAVASCSLRRAEMASTGLAASAAATALRSRNG